jgi:hypothetical protein
MRLRVEKGD